MQVFQVSIDPAPGTHTGGRGFCIGRGQMLT